MSRSLQILLVAAIAAGPRRRLPRRPRTRRGARAAARARDAVRHPARAAGVRAQDQDGRPFGPAELRERWSILFFGFTHCPDVCPSTLATLAAAPRAGRPARGGCSRGSCSSRWTRERDTAEKLKAYVAFFDPAFAGVTGAPDAIADADRADGRGRAPAPRRRRQLHRGPHRRAVPGRSGRRAGRRSSARRTRPTASRTTTADPAGAESGHDVVTRTGDRLFVGMQHLLPQHRAVARHACARPAAREAAQEPLHPAPSCATTRSTWPRQSAPTRRRTSPSTTSSRAP
jgi:cytochrome oxidase Cu insertion factor (SCO1/SenC/PrrC family)